MTRTDADMMALRFLATNGPHTMGPLEDEGALAAAMCFCDLKRDGLVHNLILGNGYVQWSLTDKGRERIAA